MRAAKRYEATIAGTNYLTYVVCAADYSALLSVLRRCVGTLVHLRHGTNSIITRTLDLDDSPLSLRDGLKADLADMRESMKRIDDDLAAARAMLEEGK